MKFLVDNAISPHVAQVLRQAGYDTAHVRDYGLQSAPDEDVFDRCVKEGRILITADTDFGLLLAQRRQTFPSVILFHYSFSHKPDDQARTLLRDLPALANSLEQGCILVFEAGRIRVRLLPVLP